MNLAASSSSITPEFLRGQLLGADASIDTPFGRRMLLYADYTASGRGLAFVEDYIVRLLPGYANTHTEDDATGRAMTRLLHEAETRIKTLVNAGPGGRAIGCGSGATGAIQKMQQIIGVSLPPATRANLDDLLRDCLGVDAARRFEDFRAAHRPVVFVGPYEHHSNEVSWREGLATVVEVDLAADGGIDLAHLQRLLSMPEYRDRPRIGSFSAASNVTGLKTPVHEIAALLHRHDALAFFDFAACAPYLAIDMNPENPGDGDASLDAIFVSGHKFLGGPGASGVLVFNERCYRRHLSPTLGGGGTVNFVGPKDHHFIDDIEAREQAGTPGILQIIRAALAFEIKHAVGEAVIEDREQRYLERAFERWRAHPRIEILGNPEPRRRIGIVSFNVRSGDGGYLHPRFVTALLNDLFGVQSRAGCSCAGPYGHHLLDIDAHTADRYRHWILNGYEGIKPGWCRVGFHYVFDDAEVDHLIDCVEFVATHGPRFLPLYEFDLRGGGWRHRLESDAGPAFGLDAALAGSSPVKDETVTSEERVSRYRDDLAAARDVLRSLPDSGAPAIRLEGELGGLQYFRLVEKNLNGSEHAAVA